MAKKVIYNGHTYDSILEYKYALGFNERLNIAYLNQTPTFGVGKGLRYTVDFLLPKLGDGSVFFEVKGLKFEENEKHKVDYASKHGTVFIGDSQGYLYVPINGVLKEATLVRCLSCGEWHLSITGSENELASYFCKNHCNAPRLDIWDNFFDAVGEHVYERQRVWPLGDMSKTPNIRFDDDGNRYVNGVRDENYRKDRK